jgi:hypothetical protein
MERDWEIGELSRLLSELEEKHSELVFRVVHLETMLNEIRKNKNNDSRRRRRPLTRCTLPR